MVQQEIKFLPELEIELGAPVPSPSMVSTTPSFYPKYLIGVWYLNSPVGAHHFISSLSIEYFLRDFILFKALALHTVLMEG